MFHIASALIGRAANRSLCHKYLLDKILIKLMISYQILTTEQKAAFAALLAQKSGKGATMAYKRYLGKLLPYEYNLYYSRRDIIRHLINRYKEIFGDPNLDSGKETGRK